MKLAVRIVFGLALVLMAIGLIIGLNAGLGWSTFWPLVILVPFCIYAITSWGGASTATSKDKDNFGPTATK